MAEPTKPRISKEQGALHRLPERKAQEELRANVLAASDEVMNRYIQGESMQEIVDSLPFPIQSWKLRNLLREMPETAEAYLEVGLQRAHNLVEDAVSHARKAGQIGDAAGYRVAVDTFLKVAAKIAPAEYGDKSKLELTGKDGGAMKILTMTDEQLLEIAARANPGPDQ